MHHFFNEESQSEPSISESDESTSESSSQSYLYESSIDPNTPTTTNFNIATPITVCNLKINIDLANSNYQIQEFPNKIILLNIPKSSKKYITYYLIKELIYNDNHNFISFTESYDEIVLFIDEQLLPIDIDYLALDITHKAIYSVVKIYLNNDEISNCDYNKIIAYAFSEKSIPVLYMNNFILIDDKYFDEAILLIENLPSKF